MGERVAPQVYSIAAHRGFADALVAGLVPRYSETGLGLARLTLLLPSRRAARTISEAFIRLMGPGGEGSTGGMLMPRMVVVGDLDLDEALGTLLDPLGASDIPPAIDPTRRLLELTGLLQEELAEKAPKGPALFRLAREFGQTMDRLLVENVAPQDLLSDDILNLREELATHMQNGLRTFARVQARWLARLAELGAVDAATRRNLLFAHAARRWREDPPPHPIVAAGVTSAAPELARLLRVVSELPEGAVILPDLDLSMSDEVWRELGNAGAPREDGGAELFAKGDAVTHPQYHLKLLLNRMGVARAEVQQWHRKGEAAAPPERTHAISSLFLPPEASKSWVDLPSERRRLSGVRLMESATPEEEAQAVALLVRQALVEPAKRVAVVTPDRGLARRVVEHLRRWNITADDSAGRPLSQTPAGRLFLLLAETMAEKAAPVPLMALLGHPLVERGEESRGEWLRNLRRLELKLRGPRGEPGLGWIAARAAKAKVGDWWSDVALRLAPLVDRSKPEPLDALVDTLASVGEVLCGDALWAREDGRALSAFVEDLRLHASQAPVGIEPDDLYGILRDAMEAIAVRPPYGGHPRVSIYGLLESRMSRAELVICCGLVEGTWPAAPAPNALLAPAVLRALGVPGGDFRIGLSAHDLAGALGAPEVVLSHAARDISGPAIPSRFVLRVKALLGEQLLERHSEIEAVSIGRALDDPGTVTPAGQPKPRPSAEQRLVEISVTALDRLRSDPYQFYASAILGLSELDKLDAEPTPAWQGTLAHGILEDWHNGEGTLDEIAERRLEEMSAHPLVRALWRPRLSRALEWVAARIAAEPERVPTVIETKGDMLVRGVRIKGKADRIDVLPDGSLTVVDYKTGKPPSGKQVEAGYALQLGTLALMAQQGGFGNAPAPAGGFEYWSLGRSDKSETDFGYIETPLRIPPKRSGIEPDEFLPEVERMLHEALDKWILGDEPFTARENPDAPVYASYDQLMRLQEWLGREA